MLMKTFNRGDTIVEVIVAFAVFSMLAVAGLSLMNQGTATAQRTLEIDLVRQQIDSQADALRFINRELASGNSRVQNTWKDVIVSRALDTSGSAVSNALTPFDEIADSQACLPVDRNQNAFAIDINDIPDLLISGSSNEAVSITLLEDIKSSVTYSKIGKISEGLSTEAQGIWIVAVKGDSGKYFDFHIRACWISPGQAAPMKLGTIVRLYEPQT